METIQVEEKRRVRLPVIGKPEESGVDVDAILREFESEQRAKLGLDKKDQWHCLLYTSGRLFQPVKRGLGIAVCGAGRRAG